MAVAYCVKPVQVASIYTAQEVQGQIIEYGYFKPEWVIDKEWCVRKAKELHARAHPTGKYYYVVIDENSNEVFSTKQGE